MSGRSLLHSSTYRFDATGREGTLCGIILAPYPFPLSGILCPMQRAVRSVNEPPEDTSTGATAPRIPVPESGGSRDQGAARPTTPLDSEGVDTPLARNVPASTLRCPSWCCVFNTLSCTRKSHCAAAVSMPDIERLKATWSHLHALLPGVPAPLKSTLQVRMLLGFSS